MSPLLEVKDLTVGFPENGQMHEVVSHISFDLAPGQILGVVGESGSGKTQTSLAVMGLLSKDAQILSGSMIFDGKELRGMDVDARSEIQGNDMSMIFQEPMTSLNPTMKIGFQIGESLKLHTNLENTQIRDRVLQTLKDVGLRDVEKLIEQFPHELSGGMRQRVMIAQAMICRPKLLIADEPTTALDVVVQSQILRLLRRLHDRENVSILFISHDLNVIREICTDVLVMYHGEIVERGSVQKVLTAPEHPYTKTLVAAIPDSGEHSVLEDRILSMRHLNIYYYDKGEGFFARKIHRQVVKDLSLDIYTGELMGIVGESGCGKSTLAKAIVGLNRDYTGEMEIAADVHPQMVFQDPFGSLNPARKIGWILTEPLRACGIRDKAEQKARVCRILKDIGLDESYYDRLPSELSGGQRQRISIGAALLMQSRLLVADEPVSALDVTVQSQILELLLKIHQERHLTILFISHDLNIVRHICSRVAVIYLGEIMEVADTDEIYERPMHPYTRLLFSAVLSGEAKQAGRNALIGNVGSGVTLVARETVDLLDERLSIKPGQTGCPFYPRCKYAMDRCAKENPKLESVSEDGRHRVKCWLTSDQ